MSGSRVLAAATWNDIYTLTEAGRRELADQVGSYRWDDHEFPATGINPPGQASDPDVDTDDGSFLFDDNSTEIVIVRSQMRHKWVEGTEIGPHIHWEQDGSGAVLWQLDHKIYNNGAAVPGSWTTLQTIKTVFPYTSGTIGQISVFAPIDMNGLTASCMVKFKISRIGGDGSDTKTGDARFTSFDFHYLNNDRGSEREYSKSNAD